MLIYILVKLKQPPREERASRQKPHLSFGITCSSEDHEMTPRGYAAEMLEETIVRRSRLSRPRPAKIDVRLRILILVVMLD